MMHLECAVATVRQQGNSALMTIYGFAPSLRSPSHAPL
jgi:hypothetical protein